MLAKDSSWKGAQVVECEPWLKGKNRVIPWFECYRLLSKYVCRYQGLAEFAAKSWFGEYLLMHWLSGWRKLSVCKVHWTWLWELRKHRDFLMRSCSSIRNNHPKTYVPTPHTNQFLDGLAFWFQDSWKSEPNLLKLLVVISRSLNAFTISPFPPSGFSIRENRYDIVRTRLPQF